MRYNISLEKEKMSESQVREAIQKAAQLQREHLASTGKHFSQEHFEKAMIGNAEKDNKDGKI